MKEIKKFDEKISKVDENFKLKKKIKLTKF